MKLNVCPQNLKNLHLIHQPWKWGKFSLFPGNAICAFLMGPHLPLGALNPYFPRYTLSVSVHANHHLRLSSPSEYSSLLSFFFFSESLAGLLRKRLLPQFWCQDCCSSFLSSSICCYFPACRFRKRTEKFASQGYAWGRIFFDWCS